MTASNPFLVGTTRLVVAIPGTRGGYLQIAPVQETTQFTELPDAVLGIAKDWAATLEAHGARRVYWIILSEAVRHLHIHLYPRWSDEEPRGLALFEQRAQAQLHGWTAGLEQALQAWSERHDVELLRYNQETQ